MTTRAVIPTDNGGGLLIQAVDTCLAGRSKHTKRAYRTRLDRFTDWLAEQSPAPFVAHLREYIGYLQDEGLSPRSIQAHVNTVKGLLRTAAALDGSGRLSAALPTLDLAKPPAVRGEVQGDCLTSDQRQRLLDAPGVDTHKGRRDTAILALLSVCGLRRSEACALNWSHVAELEGHKVIKNLSGRHGRTRTVKMPPALWRLLWWWAEQAALDTSPGEPVFVAVRKGDVVQHEQRITPNAIAWLAGHYTDKANVPAISPHDLRRTAAALARRGGASIEKVQALLGHASPQTTSDYIGETLNLDDHAVDYGKVRIGPA